MPDAGDELGAVTAQAMLEMLRDAGRAAWKVGMYEPFHLRDLMGSHSGRAGADGRDGSAGVPEAPAAVDASPVVAGDPDNAAMDFATVPWDADAQIMRDAFDDAGIPFEARALGEGCVRFEFAPANAPAALGALHGVAYHLVGAERAESYARARCSNYTELAHVAAGGIPAASLRANREHGAESVVRAVVKPGEAEQVAQALRDAGIPYGRYDRADGAAFVLNKADLAEGWRRIDPDAARVTETTPEGGARRRNRAAAQARETRSRGGNGAKGTSRPATDKQMSYIERLVEAGKIQAAEVAALGAHPTVRDANALLNRHKDAAYELRLQGARRRSAPTARRRAAETPGQVMARAERQARSRARAAEPRVHEKRKRK